MVLSHPFGLERSCVGGRKDMRDSEGGCAEGFPDIPNIFHFILHWKKPELT